MDVSSVVDRCAAWICSEPDPPAPFSYTSLYFRLPCLVLFELFSCAVPIGWLRRLFFPYLPLCENHTGWQLPVWNWAFRALSSCCIVTEESQVQKLGVGKWMEKNSQCTCKRRTDSKETGARQRKVWGGGYNASMPLGILMCLGQRWKFLETLHKSKKGGALIPRSHYGCFKATWETVNNVNQYCWSALENKYGQSRISRFCRVEFLAVGSDRNWVSYLKWQSELKSFFPSLGCRNRLTKSSQFISSFTNTPKSALRSHAFASFCTTLCCISSCGVF